MKILMVGNSFSEDAMEYVWQILTDQGQHDVVLGNLYIGGCSLQTHVENIRNDAPAYAYFHNCDGAWQMRPQYRLAQAVETDAWDYITVQQASHFSGLPEQYEPWLSELTQRLHEMCPEAKILWHMTWAYQQDSDHGGFAGYGNDQTQMYQAIVDTMGSRVLSQPLISGIIPCGTAIQNLRTAPCGDTLTRDGFHLSIPYGRYAAGLCLARSVLGHPLTIPGWMPAGVTEEMAHAALGAAEAALRHSTEVTALL